MPPPAPQPKDFSFYWDTDEVLHLGYITGSAWDDRGLLVLLRSDGVTEYMVNMDHVRWVEITDSEQA